ncbi:MAG: EamA family transporter [Verrucomicrobia bacterium]|nr:EamA family transporter [Verrucomicrobiota bacterium]
MSPVALLLILLTHATNVAGQILMKTAVMAERTGSRIGQFALAIACMTASFFLTIGLLQRFDLSYVYPFQASAVIMMALATRVFLGEKMSRRNVFAMAVIAAGVALVSAS